jgi:Asp/Glu/hydantoin racemase
MVLVQISQLVEEDHMPTILIIVPVNNTQFNETIYNAVKPFMAPDFDLIIQNIEQGCPCIESRYNMAMNTPYVIDLAMRAIDSGDIAGIFVTDMDMTGVDQLRELTTIPVLGGFQASAFTAMMLAQKFSIVTVSRSVMALQEEHIRAFGITDNFASIRSVDMSVTDLSNTDEARRRVYEQSLRAIMEDGAEAIILGCTGFVNVAAYVQNELLVNNNLDIPVIDPNIAAVSYLELLIRNNLHQSKLTYCFPPAACNLY